VSVLESAKAMVERATGIGRPSPGMVASLVRKRVAHPFRFADDGIIPNHPRWPLLLYRSPVRLAPDLDPAAILEDLFARNGWGASWRNGIHDYAHYHSRIHEVLGIARGSAKVRFGGDKGRTLDLKAGDVAVLPAGTGHQCLKASKDLLVVGAYPAAGSYDECRHAGEHDRAVRSIRSVPRPRKDPVFGRTGPLTSIWKTGAG
jgi:uncharacterized protein YjlB